MVRGAERRAIEAIAADALRVPPGALRGLPHPQPQALWGGGLRELWRAGWRHPRGLLQSDDLPAAGAPDPTDAARRQYTYVAATLPSHGKEDAGGRLKRRHPRALWIAGDLLHRSKPAVRHEWVKAEAGAPRDAAVAAAVTGGADYAAGRARVLVFANDVVGAERVGAALARAGVPCRVLHKLVPEAERAEILEEIRGSGGGEGTSSSSSNSGVQSSSGGSSGGGGRNLVVVCTDFAARGLDLPSVTHVVQAEFATNAAEFVHRIGRTARADRGGRVTSVVTPEDALLADALRSYVERGLPVEGAFSRKRSLRKGFRRHGEFVARGDAPPGFEGEGGGDERDSGRAP